MVPEIGSERCHSYALFRESVAGTCLSYKFIDQLCPVEDLLTILDLPGSYSVIFENFLQLFRKLKLLATCGSPSFTQLYIYTHWDHPWTFHIVEGDLADWLLWVVNPACISETFLSHKVSRFWRYQVWSFLIMINFLNTLPVIYVFQCFRSEMLSQLCGNMTTVASKGG